MTANRIIHHIFNQPDIRHVAQADLERLVETYPYFAAARLLLAQKQFVQHPDLTASSLKKAQLYSSNPQHLHQLLTETATPEEAPVPTEVHVPIAQMQVHAPTPVEIEELEDEISAEDQQILDEIEAEDKANAALAAQQTAAKEEIATETELGSEEEVEPEVEETITAETETITEELTSTTSQQPTVEVTPEEEIAAETELGSEQEIEPEVEGSATEELISTPPQQPTVEEIEPEVEETTSTPSQQPEVEEIEPEVEELTFTPPQQPEVEETITAEAAIEEETATATTPIIADEPGTEEEVAEAIAAETSHTIAAEEQDEIVAIDYEAIKAEKAFEEEKTSDEPDEIVAIDYEAIKAEKAFEAEKTSDEPDEIVAIDYEAIKAEKAFEEEKTSDEPDEVVAIDYEAIKAEKAFEEEKTSDEPDEIVAIDYEAIKAEKAFEKERTSEEPDEVVAVDYEALKEYEPEIEEEDIVIAAEAAPDQTAGLVIPKAPESQGQQEEQGPIRIHPIDTPEEETILTFQPLYTEDYFAYKKLKDPNTAEMMNDKAQAEMRSFTDWLRELKDNFVAGKTTKDWYHQQMHRLYEDDEPEVSERVEKMAMDSIMLNDDIVSETLAEIWVRQHQHAKAIVIYQKLSLLNPDKNAYFAQKIKDLQLLTDNNK